MTQQELRHALYTLVKTYFAGATVMWGEQHDVVKPATPFIRLKMTSDSRMTFSDEEYRTVGGNQVYVAETVKNCRLTIDLFTNGLATTYSGVTVYENSVLNDIEDFNNFLMSNKAQQIMEKGKYCILPDGQAQDLSSILDTNYEYRGMQEYEVQYVNEAYGNAGISKTNWQQTSSGGGTQSLAEESVYDIDKDLIEIEEEEQNGSD